MIDDSLMYKVFAIATPFFIFLSIRDGFDMNHIVFIIMGFLSIFLWIKDYQKNKIKKQHLKEIREMIPYV